MANQRRHYRVANSDGSYAWCATCVDPSCDQLYEQWPCAVQRLADTLAAEGIDVPEALAERAVAAAVASYAESLQAAFEGNERLARQLAQWPATPALEAMRDLPGVAEARRFAHRDLFEMSSRDFGAAARAVGKAAADVLRHHGSPMRKSTLVGILCELTQLTKAELSAAIRAAAEMPDGGLTVTIDDNGYLVHLAGGGA